MALGRTGSRNGEDSRCRRDMEGILLVEGLRGGQAGLYFYDTTGDSVSIVFERGTSSRLAPVHARGMLRPIEGAGATENRR